MAFYYVLLNGDGISIPRTPEAYAAAKLSATGHEDRGAAITGFWTTRWVYAHTETAAEKVAKSRVMHEWSELGLPACSSEPTIIVDEIRRVGWLAYFTGKPRRGFTFYSEPSP